MKFALSVIAFLLAATASFAQTSLDVSDLSVPSKIAPAYFGPNAFPVPDMTGGRTASHWKLEAYVDNYVGRNYSWSEDYTASVFLRLTVPLFSERVNLVIWGPLVEYFQMGAQACKDRRVIAEGPLSKTITGDVYVSTDFMILTQEMHGIDVAMRAALKSASGNDYSTARYYDNAGYFFDASAGRTFTIAPDRSEFNIAASAGFLCWQTDNGRQNDAVMYGLKASYRYRFLSLSGEYGGYVGWERDGDTPMTLKTRMSADIGNVTFSLGHQVGFVDWPFHQLRFGIQLNFGK